MSLLSVVILGASGYGGGELLRWLCTHPQVGSLRGTSRSRAGKPFADAHPNLAGLVEGGFEADIPWGELAETEQPVVFSALPHGELAERLPDLERAWAAAGIQDRLLLVDLSGDFRLKDAEVFAQAYGKPHPCPEHLARFAYGLPEWNRAALPGARRIASPGCFATALQLALLPLTGMDIGWMSVSAATGSSGSGASPALGTHHPLRFNDFKAYKVLNHQHLAEVRAAMEACGIKGQLAFVPQSAPMVRGIFAALSFPLPARFGKAELQRRTEEVFRDAPLVRLVADSPRVGAVAGSAFCDLSVTARDGSGVVLAAIDNLGKGMASQAIQSMNLSLGLPETLGLRIPGRYPG
jgi:N-acetyl-gamma-glutamyl-phosphate reductase